MDSWHFQRWKRLKEKYVEVAVEVDVEVAKEPGVEVAKEVDIEAEPVRVGT